MSTALVKSESSTRDAILDAAWRLLERDGARVRMSDIASAAGVSRQAVYLHFPGRALLFQDLVAYMDEALGVPELAGRVHSAASGIEALERLADLYAALTPRIEGVARVLEAAQDHDPELASAWTDRMHNREAAHRAIAERLASEKLLRSAWTVEAAADLISALTLPAAWRVMAAGRGRTADQYRDQLAHSLLVALTRD